MLSLLAAIVMPLPQATAPARAVPSDPALERMTTLYEEICLKAFPEDQAVAAAMTAHGATELTKKELRVFLHDDPGRGWWIADGSERFTVTVEAPPYHACSVRREAAAPFADVTPYSDAIARYRAGTSGFAPMAPQSFDVNGVRSEATGFQRATPDGGAEALYAFTNTPGLRTPVELRFVHQIVAPNAH